MGVAIWVPLNPSINFFSGLSIHGGALKADLQYILYLDTMEEAPVSTNFHIPSGMVCMVDIWEASSYDDEVDLIICAPLLVQMLSSFLRMFLNNCCIFRYLIFETAPC